MAVCLLMIGALYARYGVVTRGAVVMDSHKARWAVIVLIYLFTANFSWSWAVVGYSSILEKEQLFVWLNDELIN